MKKMVLILLLLSLFPQLGWGESYYVSRTGSNTSPYDTQEKAANELKTVIDYIRENGAGNNTITIGPGTYTNGAYARIDHAKLNNLTINGAGRELTVLNPTGANPVTVTDGNGLQVNNLTLKPALNNAPAFYATNASDTITINNVDFVAPKRYTWHLFWNANANIDVHSSRFFHQHNAGYRSVVYMQNAASGTFVNCLSMAAGHTKSAGTWSLAGTGAVAILNTVILDAQGSAITVSGTGAVRVKNSIVSGGVVNSSSATIYTGNRNVTLADNIIIANPWAADALWISGSYTNGGGNILTNPDPKFIAYPRRRGYILPRIDDAGNFGYARQVESVLAAKGFKGTFFTTYYDWNPANNEALRTMVRSGVIEVGSHSYDHSDLSLTGKLMDVVKGSETLTIDRSADTITLSGGGVVSGFRAKTLGAIKSELESFGAVVTPIAGWNTSSPGAIKSCTPGEVIADSTVTNQLSLLIDNTAATGYYKSEIADPKRMLDSLINGVENVVDPQTGSTYQVVEKLAHFDS